MTRAAVLALVAGALAAAALVELAAAAGERAERDGARRPRGALARALLGALARLGLRTGIAPLPPSGLPARLAAAGLPARVGPAEIMAVKAGAVVAGAVFALLPALGAPGRLGPVVAVAGPLGGFLAPDAWLRRSARRRARIMADELPEVLDLLRVVVAAGLPVGRAMGEVGRRRGGLLAGELAAASDQMALGVPREQALAAWRLRCPVRAAPALVVAIRRADRHGAPLAPALAALAADARADRARRLGDRAARAAPKIQLVIALGLVPSALLLVAAALLGALG